MQSVQFYERPFILSVSPFSFRFALAWIMDVLNQVRISEDKKKNSRKTPQSWIVTRMLVKIWFCPNCEHQFWVSPSLDSTCSLLCRPLVWMVHGLIQWSVDLFIWQYALKGLPFRGKIIRNSEQRFLCSRHIHQRLDYPVCSTPGRANDFHFWALWLQGRSNSVINVPKSRWPELSEELEEEQVAKEPQSLWEHCISVS